MCYKDKTFCGFYKTCSNAKDCNRCLTDEIKLKAQAAHLDICQFAEEPECYSKIRHTPEQLDALIDLIRRR